MVLVAVAAWALQESVTTGFHWAFLASVLVSLVSRLPWYLYSTAYLGIALVALLLQRRVWQVPMLAMFSVTFLGTLVLHALTYLYLGVTGVAVSVVDTLGAVTLPSVLLNMLIAIPVYGLMRDLSRWVFRSAGPP